MIRPKFKQGDIVKFIADINRPVTLSSSIGVVLGRNEPPDDAEGFLAPYNGHIRIKWFPHNYVIAYPQRDLNLHDEAM